MTTLNVEDITRKGRVERKYNPNSYRIFCEDISNDSVAYKEYQAPDIYSQPPILPAQAIEDRNRPHGGRTAGFLRENVRTLNEPVGTMHIGSAAASNTRAREQSRWWEWNTPNEDDDPLWKNKKRSQSTTNLNGSRGVQHQHQSASNTNSGFQTTYQKEHGYLKDILLRSNNNRHAFNPENQQAIGIVPVTELKATNNENIYVDKMSFNQQYNSRDADNYPHKGKRQGAFVLEHYAPRHELGTQTRGDLNKNTNVWDCMHPQGDVQKQQMIRQPSQLQPQQRRDPIGYFEDTKYQDKPQPQQQQQQERQQSSNVYHPSWANGYSTTDQNGKELLENALNANSFNNFNARAAYVQN